MGKLMAAIVIGTMLALAYLTQTLGTSATSAEIRALQVQQGEMKQEIVRHATLVLKKVDTDELRTEARRQGLRKLPKAVILKAP